MDGAGGDGGANGGWDGGAGYTGGGGKAGGGAAGGGDGERGGAAGAGGAAGGAYCPGRDEGGDVTGAPGGELEEPCSAVTVTGTKSSQLETTGLEILGSPFNKSPRFPPGSLA